MNTRSVTPVGKYERQNRKAERTDKMDILVCNRKLVAEPADKERGFTHYNG